MLSDHIIIIKNITVFKVLYNFKDAVLWKKAPLITKCLYTKNKQTYNKHENILSIMINAKFRPGKRTSLKNQYNKV